VATVMTPIEWDGYQLMTVEQHSDVLVTL